MPLKVIGAGFGRTGTMSLNAALNQLGLRSFHMLEILRKRPSDLRLEFWRQVANAPVGTQHNWERAFSSYTATVDTVACSVWRALATAYPNAKIILTLHPRGAQAWFESAKQTYYSLADHNWQFRVLEIVTPLGRQFGDLSRKLIWERLHGGAMNDRGKAISHYERHIEEVRATVPKDRLLVFSADQGWAPLCRFLEAEEPAGGFPNVNDRAEAASIIADITRNAFGALGNNFHIEQSSDEELLEAVKRAFPQFDWAKEYEKFRVAHEMGR